MTVQLPLYNELYVVERLLECITALDYPKDKLQIQVLDDSADESLELTQKLVRAYQAKEIPIIHIHRKERKGFKAGALKEGLETASGELIAIFDSDFLPESDWLYKTVPQFENAKVGVVQTRWGHLNRTYSPWTSVQAFALDAHFLLEQIGRNQQQYFINFNGTAGVWRKSAYSMRNWEGDTLTEDLDLSYRAQLKNWKFVYLDEVVTLQNCLLHLTPYGLSNSVGTKEGLKIFKMIGRVMKSKNLSWKVKFNAAVHLLNSTMFFNVLIVSFKRSVYLSNQSLTLSLIFDLSGLFILYPHLYTCYWFVHRTVFGSGIASFFHYTRRFLLFYCLVIGFSIHNSVAV